MEIKRDRYLKQLIESRQNGFIKVVTGIRRCGKSYLLNVLFYHYLLDNGVADDHIIRIDLEDRMNKDLRNPDMMLHYVHDRIKDKELYYIIIDEVQLMDEFVDVLNSFRHIDNADTYVTGSNSHFLSSDIPTEFRGRGETIHVNPLSFAEFYSAVGGDKQDAWREYYTYGGLPLIQSFETEEKKINYLKDLFETVYLADIIERHKIKNDNELRELVLILASSIGAPCNPTKLSNTFKSVKNVSIGSQTISNYLTFLSESFLLNKAIRYDIKGKKYINTLSKYYWKRRTSWRTSSTTNLSHVVIVWTLEWWKLRSKTRMASGFVFNLKWTLLPASAARNIMCSQPCPSLTGRKRYRNLAHLQTSMILSRR